MNRTHQEHPSFLDRDSGVETARLITQARLVTETMGGVLPHALKNRPLQHVLDIGAGPGGWVCDLAFAYQQTQVLGIDKSRVMVDYARAFARVQGFDNAQFRQMDAREPLAFADASFDLVHARLLSTWMPRSAWPAFLGECLRILRPSGILCLIEGECALTTSPACEQLSLWCLHALQQAGYSFSPDGRHLGITAMLGHFLRTAGCQSVQHEAFGLDFSAGTRAHKVMFDNHLALMSLLEPFLLERKATTSAELAQVIQQATIEMLDQEFCGLWWLLRVWGQIP